MGFLVYLAIGFASGLFAGFFGLGGGVVLIPALVYFLGMSQHKAQGTSLLALIPPVGLLAAWRYWKSGFIGPSNIPIAAWVALGLFVGAYFGGYLVKFVDDVTLKRVFGILVVLIGAKLIIWPKG